MDLPATSGHVARLLNVTEPKLNSLIRQGRIDPMPSVLAGRRLWHREHVLQAAEQLGCLTPTLRRMLSAPGEAVSRV